MRKQFYLMFIFLFGLFLLSACQNNTPSETKQHGSSGNVVSTLNDLGGMKYKFSINNQSVKNVTLNFSTTQQFDYEIRDKQGKQIYLYSKGKSFGQEISQVILKQGERRDYFIELSNLGLSKGKYQLIVWLTTSGQRENNANVTFLVK